MAWWLEGAISRHFGWVRNPEAIFFAYFWSQEKNKNKKFPGKIGFFSGINRFLSEKSAIFHRFFFSDFSIPISFPAPPKSDFSSKNRPKSAIFLSMSMTNQ